MKRGDWIQTFLGFKFYPFDPKPEEIALIDIAHALSNQCRFSGHCAAFYSVAQHSVHVSENVPRNHGLWALLHDAPEAYLVDLPRPIKRHSEIGALYSIVEDQLMKSICQRFGLPEEQPESVKAADEALLATEHRDLMTRSPAWSLSAKPLAMRISPLLPIQAERLFLKRFEELTS